MYLVEDGFAEHPVAEFRQAAGGVLEFPEDRFDFRPQRIIDQQQVECHDCSPIDAVDREHLYQDPIYSSTRLIWLVIGGLGVGLLALA